MIKAQSTSNKDPNQNSEKKGLSSQVDAHSQSSSFFQGNKQETTPQAQKPIHWPNYLVKNR